MNKCTSEIQGKEVYQPEPVPITVPEAPESPVSQWRTVNFETAETDLKKDLKRHKETRLSIVLIGQTGAGKSLLINSIYSISKGRIVDISTSKSDDLSGVGTYHFVDFPSTDEDMFTNIHIFDTMGFTGIVGSKSDDGITDADLQAVCEGRVKDQHKFNAGAASADVPIEKNIPKCVVIVVSAEELGRCTDNVETAIHQKMNQIYKLVPQDAAKIAVITKVDRVCDETNADIRNIFSSKKVYGLVKKATSVFGMEVNKVFPIVNFCEEMEVESAKSIPILYALKFALNFASDRSQHAQGKIDSN